jgi:hypothetical protein
LKVSCIWVSVSLQFSLPSSFHMLVRVLYIWYLISLELQYCFSFLYTFFCLYIT